FTAIHVVGTKGKSTAARRIARTIGGPAYTSPHVSGWHERLDTDPAGLERAVARIRAEAEAVAATQFEAITAAAFADFADCGATHAAVEAGLGGRHDATNVIDAPVVLLTNVGLEHTDVLGATREQIAAEKLAVAGRHAIVILPDGEFAHLVPGEVRIGGAEDAVEALLGRRVPLAVASILADKDAPAILERLARAGTTFVATQSSNARSLPAEALAGLARATFATVETESDPHAALAHARRLGPRVLVTGSLYLLADLAGTEWNPHTMSRARERISVFLFAVLLLLLFVGLAFAAGYGVGRMLL